MLLQLSSSYQQIAKKLGRSGAAQAVGNAVGANPIAFIIPCHRVLKSGGGLGGNRWGLERKKALIQFDVRQ